MLERVFKYFGEIFKVSIPQKQVLQQLYQEYRASLIKSYQIPHLQSYIKSLPVSSLLKKSVQLYVGSRGIKSFKISVLPRNDIIMKMLLEQATIKAKDLQSTRDEQNIKYYSSYFVKMDAMKENNPKNYEYASDMLMELADEGHELSNYLVGKELYKLIQTGETGEYAPDEIIPKCKGCFVNSICNEQIGGLYYIADMLEKDGIQNTDLQYEDIREMYIQAASLGHQLSLFKLALMYKKQGNVYLYKKYLLQAAQKGVVEAQHNLGHEYLSGEFFPKNDVKALAWFSNAAVHGFTYSKYNLYKLWREGSTCGRIKPYKDAALIYLQEVHRSGEIDVSKELEQFVQQIDGKKKAKEQLPTQ